MLNVTLKFLYKPRFIKDYSGFYGFHTNFQQQKNTSYERTKYWNTKTRYRYLE